VRSYSVDSPWDFDPAITYLTHGTYGACPRPVVEAQRAMLAELESNPIQFLTRDLEARWDEARRTVAEFLGADPEGLVAIPNATAGVATVLASLRLRPGDELLTNDHEYNATLNALALTAERAKARVVQVQVPLPIQHPEQVVEAILAGVTPRTRLALISHVTSPSGLVFPIESIVRELDRMGVDTLVDAAHAPGMLPVEVDALGAAYWTGNGHKWLCGPKAAGFLVVREDRRSGVVPLVTSHGRNDTRVDRPQLWRVFDWQGTSNPTAFLALPEAIRVIGELAGGWASHMAANRALAIEARRLLNDRLGLAPIAPETMLGAMASIRLPERMDEARANAIAQSLADEEQIEVPVVAFPVPAARVPGAGATHTLLRMSAQRYNELGDYESLADALERRRLGARSGAVAASGIVAG
jgi:isopenicillin-N epimerase